MYGKNGDRLVAGDAKVSCNGDAFIMDISSMLPPNIQGMGNGEVELEGDGFHLPFNLKAGDELPDSKNTVHMSMGPVNMHIPFEMTNVKVEGVEEVDTPAGTFEAYKISYDTYTKAAIVKVYGSVVNWYAKGVGNIKTETYDKKGRLISTQELTKFEK